MSPRPLTALTSLTGFPRVSGDEPDYENVKALKSEFSPRERG